MKHLETSRKHPFLLRKYLTPGPNRGILCVRQSDATPFCENYAKLYFGAKYLEKGLNRRR